MAGNKRDTYKYRQTKVAAKQVTITLTDKHRADAIRISKETIGRANLSGFIAYLIEKECRERQE